jgi:ubiquinone/menaquinone biosynthesis C-methylase UbiE
MARKLSHRIKYLFSSLVYYAIPSQLYLGAKRFAYFYSKAVANREKFSPQGVHNARHLENLDGWYFSISTNLDWLESGVLARMAMKPGFKVLDLCCGDGAYSYLFFRDIASHIDAVDYSSKAIKHAKKFFSADNITHHVLNILEEDFPSFEYDLVFWRAGIAYFDDSENRKILEKISMHLKSGGYLIGETPKATPSDQLTAGQKRLFASRQDLMATLGQFFPDTEIIETIYPRRINLNFRAVKD